MFKPSITHPFLTVSSIAGLCTLVGALAWQAPQQAQRLRVETEQSTLQALAEAGHGWAHLEIQDAVGRIVGEAPDAASRHAAMATARAHLAPAMAWPGVFWRLQDATRVAVPLARGLPRVSLTAQAEQCHVLVDQALAGRRVLFERGSAQLTADSRRLLVAVAAVASQCPIGSLAVQGHTDATGQPLLNQRLSQQRAEAVVAALVQAGVPAARLQPQGLGASRPLALGSDAATQAQNRRIEFHWTVAAV